MEEIIKHLGIENPLYLKEVSGLKGNSRQNKDGQASSGSKDTPAAEDLAVKAELESKTPERRKRKASGSPGRSPGNSSPGKSPAKSPAGKGSPAKASRGTPNKDCLLAVFLDLTFLVVFLICIMLRLTGSEVCQDKITYMGGCRNCGPFLGP